MARAAAAWSKWEMSVFSRSSQLPPNRLRDLLDGDLCELPADDQPSDLRATWAWSPSSARWECGGVELPEAAVRTALSEDGFSAHIACALSQQSALPMPPRAGVGGAVERARQFYQRAIEAHVPGGASEDGLTPLSDVAAAVAAAAAAASRGNASSSSLPSGGGLVPVQARLTSTFSERRAFFASDDELLDLVRAGGESLRRIPCIAVQGGNDIICPPSTAYELHEAWPEMELRVVPAGGHSHYDSGLMAELLRATDAIRDRRHSERAGGGR
uniref:Prolyl aminopeptidase n=2 Tax=Emiliania huxleyi TaxID=2903 RepID=A0A7S3TSU9_EMIHU